MMIRITTLLIVPLAGAFAPSPSFVRHTSSLAVGSDPNVYLGGNTWKPDSEKMGSTDTGDYFPEGYSRENEVAFTEGMGGSQAMLGGGRGGPQLPGMENLGADAVVQGGLVMSDDFPPGMQFIPSSVPDGVVEFSVGSTSGASYDVSVKPVCMTFEDYYAAFSPDSHPSLSVSPAIGRMDRRGGEATIMTVRCEPEGASGKLEGNLVINLPEDNSKICYKVIVSSF